jgi:uncharacterized membrane protein
LSIKVIHAPVSYQGPIPGTLDTSQVQLTLTPSINTTVSGLTVTGQLPLTVSGAGAHGVMDPGRCATNPGMDVTVTPKTYTETSSATLSVAALGLNVASVAASANTSINGNQISPALTFNYPADFPPSDGTLGPSQRAGGTTIGLPGLSYTLNVSLLGLGTSVPAVQQAVTTALTPILNNLDSTISPVLRGLGIQVGGADAWALNLTCNGQIGQTQQTVTAQLVN